MKRLLAAVLLFAGMVGAGSAACPVAIETSTGAAVHYQLELARTPAARARGLMGRRTLPAQGGMLFDLGAPEPAVFWMRNTPLALDILFVSEDLRVVDVIANAKPNSDRLLPSSVPVRFAVELAGGETARRRITPGARVTLPPSYPVACP